MKKTLLLFVFIFSAFYSFSQCQVDTAYNFEVISLQQDTFNLDEFWEERPNAKVVLEFNFVDSPLCKEVSPMVNEAYKKFGCNEHDVFFLSLNVSNDSLSTQHYYDTLGLEYPMVAGVSGGSMVDSIYDIHAYPTVVLLQKDINIFEYDTTYVEENDVITDTIITETVTNILSRDIWPVISADSLIASLMEFGLDTASCEGQNSATGIAENLKQSKTFSLYPNPAQNHINILSHELEGRYQIEILDISGKAVLLQNIYFNTHSSLSLHVGTLEKGIYILKIFRDQEVYTEKLLIQ